MSQLSAYDTDLLNVLWQPTAYANRYRRAEALKRYKKLCVGGMEMRLAGGVGRHQLAMAQRYMELYQFTQEELDGSSTEA